MSRSPSRAGGGTAGSPNGSGPTRPGGPPALIFDGECPFCTASALWVRRRLRRPAELLPWQKLAETGRLGPFGLTTEETKRWAWWVEGGRGWRGHRAAGRALLACRGAWPLAGRVLLAPPPLSWIFALGYFVVSHTRKYLGGVEPACEREVWPPPLIGR